MSALKPISTHSASTGHCDVAVVGAGLAGLAAANYAAAAGAEVAVYERSGRIGGRGGSTTEGGYVWNWGPHALYRTGEASAVLDELGVEYTGKPPLGSGGVAVRGGKRHTLPSGLLSMLTTSLMGVAGKIETGRFLAGLAKLDCDALNGATLDEHLARSLKDPTARDFVRALVRLTSYCNAPGLMSAGVALGQLRAGLDASVLYLDGGWQGLSDALAERVRASGASVRTGAYVQSIAHDGAGFRIAFKDGSDVRAGAVVLGVLPEAASAMLAPELVRPVRGSFDALTPVRAACLDLVLRRLPDPRIRFALGVDCPMYFSVHSAYAKLSTGGPEKNGLVVHALRYLAPGESGAEALELLEHYCDVVQPGWPGEVEHRRFLPGITVAGALPGARGGGLAGRPAVAHPSVDGLYFAGDWVGPTALLADASLASGRCAGQQAGAYVRKARAKAA